MFGDTEVSVLIVSRDVARAAKLQRSFHEQGVPAYFAMTISAGTSAFSDLHPEVLIVDHDVGGGSLSLLRWAATSRPAVLRVLLTATAARLFERELRAGILDAVAFEHNVLATVERFVRAGRVATRGRTHHRVSGDGREET